MNLIMNLYVDCGHHYSYSYRNEGMIMKFLKLYRTGHSPSDS